LVDVDPGFMTSILYIIFPSDLPSNIPLISELLFDIIILPGALRIL